MPSIDAQRVCLIRVVGKDGRRESFGSGFLCDGRRVVTCAHVVLEDLGAEIEVRLLSEIHSSVRSAKVTWLAPANELDAAVVELDDEVEGIEPIQWGRFDRSAALDAEFWGFPRATKTRSGGGVQRVDAHVEARLTKGGLARGQLELQPEGEPRSADGWKGMSGAGVLVGGRLVGVFAEGTVEAGGRRVWAVPATRILEHSDARAALGNPLAERVPPRATWQEALGDFFLDFYDAYRLRNFLHRQARPVHDALAASEPGEDFAELVTVVIRLLESMNLVNEQLLRNLEGRGRYTAQVGPIRALWRAQRAPGERTPEPPGSVTGAASPTTVPSPARDRPTHTSVVLDRIRQWGHILKACAEDDRDLLFLVHASREQDLDVFMQRIRDFLEEECSRRHRVLTVEQQADHTRARTQEDWERQFIRATRAGTPPLGFAIQRDAKRGALLFLVEDRGGPLRDLDEPAVRGLHQFLRDRLSGALATSGKSKPVRVVIPIEQSDEKSRLHKELLTLLASVGRRGPLHVEPPLELHFPSQKDVEDHINADDVFRNIDGPTRERCLTVYREVAASPGRSLQELGDRLHEILFKWESDRW